jgi:predicted deacylase
MNRTVAIVGTTCALLGALPLAAQKWDSYALGTVTARPGERVSGWLEVPAGVDDGVRLPITVFRGRRAGPTVAMVAGIHGAEYAPIVALQRLRSRLDATTMFGTVVMVHLANPVGFLARSVYVNPTDRKNLNRVFPGNPAGTQTERIARTLTSEIVGRADYLFDLHAGDANEALRHYTVVYGDAGDSTQVARAMGMAHAFGIDYIVIHRGMTRDTAATTYLSATGAARRVATLAVESGEGGRVDEEAVARIERGLLSVLAHVGVIPGQAARVEHPVYIGDAVTVRSPATGMFYPMVEAGQLVRTGTLLGRITNFFGESLAEVRSPIDGVLRYMVAAPPISEGETLASVGRVGVEPPAIATVGVMAR